jgi:hypothetical protein
MTGMFPGALANDLFSDAIRNQIIKFIEDSVPTSTKLTPVQNGKDYCRRLRCVQWAYDLADAADLLGLPQSGFHAPIKDTIKSAQLFLKLQKNEHFRLMSLTPEGGGRLREQCEDHLNKMMEDEGVEE